MDKDIGDPKNLKREHLQLPDTLEPANLGVYHKSNLIAKALSIFSIHFHFPQELLCS